MTNDHALRIAAVVAAVALVASPYWDVIAGRIAQAAKSAGVSRTHAAWALAACLIIAAGWGYFGPAVRSVRLPTLSHLGGLLRLVAGVGVIWCAAVLGWRQRREKPAPGLADVSRAVNVLLIAVGILLIGSGPAVSLPTIHLPTLPHVPTIVPSTVTAAVYVYEKDAGPVPAGVHSGIDRLNRDKKILASLFEDDTVDGTGETPEQYRPALNAAKAKSIPSLVVLAGTNAVKVVANPQTEADVWEAVP